MRTARRNILLSAAIGGVLIVGLTSAWAQVSGILNKDWSAPTKGSYEAPAAEIGKKTSNAQPWSVTTVASSIAGKTVPGKAVSMVGEIVDLSCYLQVGKRGDKHRDCGQKCVRHGQPVGLLTQDGSVYLLMDEEHDPRRDGLTEFRQQAIEHMAHVVTIRGTLTNVGGQKAIYVQGFVKK